ncbi:hypothetical protein D3C81_1610540 [compost metagenome]
MDLLVRRLPKAQRARYRRLCAGAEGPRGRVRTGLPRRGPLRGRRFHDPRLCQWLLLLGARVEALLRLLRRAEPRSQGADHAVAGAGQPCAAGDGPGQRRLRHAELGHGRHLHPRRSGHRHRLPQHQPEDHRPAVPGRLPLGDGHERQGHVRAFGAVRRQRPGLWRLPVSRHLHAAAGRRRHHGHHLDGGR